jgi:Recombinase zinc beta ribbon domain
MLGPMSMDASSLTRHAAQKAHPSSGRILQPIDKWEICLHNRYPAYISWDEFVANQAQLRANSMKYREEQPGMARTGQALLQGIVRCGRCGALFHLHYSGKQGEYPEYRCSADQSQFGGTDCQRVRALALDTQVEQRFLEALQPDQLAIALAALAQLEQEEQTDQQAMGAAPGACTLPGQAGRTTIPGSRARKPPGGSRASEAVGRAAPGRGNRRERVSRLEMQSLWDLYTGGPRGHCRPGQRFTSASSTPLRRRVQNASRCCAW